MHPGRYALACHLALIPKWEYNRSGGLPGGVCVYARDSRIGVVFYPSILGAVLFGIGIALLIERFRRSGGLGLLGAIGINLSGGVALAGWLVWGCLALPPRGRVVLWTLVVLLVGVSSFELLVLKE